MATSYRLELSPRAKADTEAVHDEIASDRPLVAEKWMRGLYAKLRSLRRNPFLYEIIPEPFNLGVMFRHALFKSHRIIYTVVGTQITVFRVIHAARVLRERMLEEP